MVDNDLREQEDVAWLESDISNLRGYEPYDRQPGEIGEDPPAKYIPSIDVVIVEELYLFEMIFQQF